MSIVLEVTALQKRYGPIPVLHDVSLSVADGETLAIIGPNGAGKTTLFKTLTGEVLPEGGQIQAFGRDVTRLDAPDRVALGFGRTFQVARIFPEVTLIENVVVAIEARKRLKGESLGAWYAWKPSDEIRDEAAEWLDRVSLGGRQSEEARFLSHGDKKRLEMAVTLALRPRLLMMDEPTAGMSPSDRIETVDLIREVRERYGVTVLLTEHDMDVVFNLSDRIMVLNYGQVIATGTRQDIRANPAVQEVYLGHDDDA
jgi:branched-chain amino acid transport system ATP-binding protein